jgi:hypothetical protein
LDTQYIIKTHLLLTQEFYLKGEQMKNFRKKPVVIQAEQYNKFTEKSFLELIPKSFISYKDDEKVLCIPTLEGVMTASYNDWIICGVHGEFYPCKPDIFEKTYEPV